MTRVGVTDRVVFFKGEGECVRSVYEAKKIKIKIKIRDSLYSGVNVLRAQKKVENRRDWDTAGKHLR